jgi:hypothetical protein
VSMQAYTKVELGEHGVRALERRSATNDNTPTYMSYENESSIHAKNTLTPSTYVEEQYSS